MDIAKDAEVSEVDGGDDETVERLPLSKKVEQIYGVFYLSMLQR